MTKVLWFTGLSGVGKSTLSEILSDKLSKLNYKVKIIDGDIFRLKNKNKNNFSKSNIIKNNITIINHIKKIKKKYDFILVSVISPLLITRNIARNKFGKNYFEIYVKCKIKTLEKRDTKKLYAKAKKNIIKNLIGYNSNIKYESSIYKKIIIDTDKLSKFKSIKKIIKKCLIDRNYMIRPFNMLKKYSDMKKIKIICTLGPASYRKRILKILLKEKVDIFRINLSHTNTNQIKKIIKYLKKNKITNICIDTEGAQIRTTLTKRKYFIKKNCKIKIFNERNLSNDKKIYLYPHFDLNNLDVGTRIDIGFNSLSIQVVKKNSLKGYLLCKVLNEGYLDSKKGVHIHTKINLPCLTQKDRFALKLARELNIKYYAISFVNSHEDLNEVKKIIGNKSFIISKIETKNAIINLNKIIKKSDALLIDRGDLSRYVPIEKIPVAQESIIKQSVKLNTPTYVATNLLESMIKENEATRAESHDIYSTLKEGANGLVLAAETAIGKNPIECVRFIKRCLAVYKKNKDRKNEKNYLFR